MEPFLMWFFSLFLLYFLVGLLFVRLLGLTIALILVINSINKATTPGHLCIFIRPLNGGDEDAQFILGNMYAVGEGVQQDFRHAAFWYRKAAEKGFALAQYDLGTMYYNGLGLSRDFKHAYAWLFAASENGYVEALIVSYYAAAELDAQAFAEAQKLATKYLEQFQPGK